MVSRAARLAMLALLCGATTRCVLLTDFDSLSEPVPATAPSDGGTAADADAEAAPPATTCPPDTKLASDARHCGRCGHDCEGGDCVGGECQPFVLASTPSPYYLAHDGTHLYATTFKGGTLVRVPKRGGAVETLASGLKVPFGIDVDDTYVYFVESPNDPTSAVRRMRKASPVDEPPLATGTHLIEVRAGADALYWSTFGTASGGATVFRANKDGSGAIPIASDRAGVETIALAGSVVFFAEGSIRPTPAPQLWRYAPGDATPVAIGPGPARRMVTDGTSLFHVQYGSPALRRTPVTGGASVVLGSATGNVVEGSLALDDAFVYWVSNGSGEVLRTPKGGGETIRLATAQAGPVGIAVDESAVYWTQYDGNRIMKRVK